MKSGDSIHLFVCHSSLDKRFVRRLKKELNAFRYKVWVDENEIKVGDSILGSIESALAKVDYVLLILSPNFNLSSWAKSELEATFQLEVKHKTKKILPCLIKETDLPLLISGRKYANFSKKFRTGLIELVDSITPADDHNPHDVYVTNSVVTLDIQDTKGLLVKYAKKCTHSSLVNGLKSYNDCFAVSGSIENVIVNKNPVSKIRRESGMHFFEVAYSRPLAMTESEKFYTTADIVDSFTEPEEHWETMTNNHNADKFTVFIKFPKDRHPTDWYLEERIGTKYTRKGKEGISHEIDGDRAYLKLVIKNPIHFVAYIIRWKW